MDISGIGLAVADMPRQLFKTARACSPHREDSNKLKREDSQPASSGSSMRDALRGRSLKSSGSRSNLSLVSSPDTIDTSSTLLGETDSITSKSLKDQDSDSTGQQTPSGTITPVSSEPPPPPKSAPKPQEKECVGAEAIIEAGKGVGHIVGMGVRTPMNFTLGLAKGFRNMPRLYNDDTVRPEEKVSDFRSGLKVAGREFGFGLYDGISGLITQPLHGAEKEGAAGLVKGIGKGLAGIVTKPAAGKYSSI
jgi:hypothetical protein